MSNANLSILCVKSITDERRLKFKVEIQTQIDDTVYDNVISARLKNIIREPTFTYDLDKLVYPIVDQCDEEKKCMSMVSGIYPCAFDKDVSTHFVVWVHKNKINDMYQFIVDLIDKPDKDQSSSLIIGVIVDTALSMYGSPDDKYQVDFYSNADDINDAIDMFKIYFHKYAKYIYYR